MGCYILLDVGGTGIRASAVSADGTKLAETRKYPSNSGDSASVILDGFSRMISEAVREAGKNPECICFAFPGPFDYEKGISYMRGIGKYDSIYGIEIPAALRERNDLLSGVPMMFMHDVEAYAVGAYHKDLAEPLHHVMAVALGTGCGSAFLVDGKAAKEGEGVPENGWIYSYPFRDSIIDDYLSARGQDRLSAVYFGKAVDGKVLDILASNGDMEALKMFSEFGDELYSALLPFIDGFRPEAIILGGSISGSARFFTERIGDHCRKTGCRLIVDTETSERAMHGLWIAARGAYGIG